MIRPEYLALKRDLETIRKANLAEAAANERMANLIVTYLNPPLEETEVLAFESQYNIRLPEEYREFLLTVANGGVGPVYALERLGQYNGTSWDEIPGMVGELSSPFPYIDQWNAKPIDASRPVEEQYQQQDWYWDARHVNGAIPISSLGCGLVQLLIVTGSERGNIWFDDRADWKGLYPDSTDHSKRVTFFEWYRNWADDELRVISQKN